MDSQQLVFLVILAGTLALFISNRVRIDLAAMLTLLALNPSRAFSHRPKRYRALRASRPSSWPRCS